VIVVDTNVVAYLYLDSERTAEAEAALRRDADWAAPRLWRSELRNVLAVQVRAGRLQAEEAVAVQEAAERQMTGGERAVASRRVLELAAASGCSAYDCEFVALAHRLGVPLVTTDRQVLAAFPRQAVDLGAFAATGSAPP
jgi:predicted nucleic acid-binding protein